MPVGCRVTHSFVVVDVPTHTEDRIRVQLTVGGNTIEYTGKLTTKTADLTTFKINTNDVIYTRGTGYSGWDIRNYYLEITMGWS